MSLLAAAAGLLAVALLALAIPVELRLTVRTRPEVEVHVALDALLGLVARDLSSQAKTPAAADPHSAPPTEGDRGGWDRRAVLAALATPGLAATLRRCLTRLWRSLRFADLSLRGRLGLGDPCETGRLFAVLGPLAAAGATVGGVVAIEPDFADEVAVDLDGGGRLRAVPLLILAALTRCLLSPPALRASVRLWRARR